MGNSADVIQARSEHKVSQMAENLIGSEIIKLAGEVREMIARGEKVYNFTIGDFDPHIFPIPDDLKKEIINAYVEDETNYPAAEGILELRKNIAALIRSWQDLDYNEGEILVAGGARPLIYAIYQAIVDPGESVLFPVPSWNNNHYCHLSHAKSVMVETKAENNFMPLASELAPYLENAALLSLCSPLNPTGTVFGRAQLEEICDLVIAENQRRGTSRKPLYIMYDQIYWQLTFGGTIHFDPVSLRPELRPFTIYVDGISKSFAATGVRVGWSFGPKKVIDKMKAILGHVGAWSPRAEQIATARFLKMNEPVTEYLSSFRHAIEARLEGFYKGMMDLKREGFPVDAIAPQAAIYLTVRFQLMGKQKPNGESIETIEQTTSYLLNEARLAIVPFHAFGAKTSDWYRLSVGTATMEDVEQSIQSVRTALARLV